MFIELPKQKANKFSLFVSKETFKLRIYRNGYVVFMLMLWDRGDEPLVWWSTRKSPRNEFGKAIKTKAAIAAKS